MVFATGSDSRHSGVSVHDKEQNGRLGRYCGSCNFSYSNKRRGGGNLLSTLKKGLQKRQTDATLTVAEGQMEPWI